MRLALRRIPAFVIALVMVFAYLVAQPARASYDATGVTFNLTDAKLSFLSGSKTTATGGTIAVYSQAAVIQGLSIDVVVEVINNANTILEFDCGTGSTIPDGGAGTRCGGSGVTDSYWDLLTNGSGTYEFEFSFFESGTFTGGNSGIPVVLTNLTVSTLDLDSTQAAQFSSFQGYRTLKDTPSSGSSIVSVSNAGDGKARFTSSNIGLAGFDECEGIAEVTFNSVSSFGFDAISPSTGVAGFLAVLGSTGLTCVTSSSGNNPANRPPTASSSQIDINVAQGFEYVIEERGLGYADPDQNPLSKVRFDTVPANAKIQRNQGDGTWADLSNGAEVTAAEISAGLIRVADITASSSLTFSVNDGLVYSSSSYTIALNLVTSTQTISFANPGTKASGQTFASGATASSGLTVSLTSNTTSVCTVSGLNITTIAEGTCSITASQQGDSTYATAQSVTQVFSVSSKQSQTITFPQIATQTYSGVNVTIASGASSDSGLSIDLSTSTGTVCEVSGLNIVVKAVGTCTVKARQAGDATYAPAEVTQSFSVTSNPAPTLSSSVPANGATYVLEGANLTLNFSEAVTAVSGKAVKLYSSSGNLVETVDAGSGRVTGSTTTTIVVDFVDDLALGQEFYVLIDTGAFADGIGQPYAGISSSSTLRFTSIPVPSNGLTLALDAFEGSPYADGNVVWEDLIGANDVTLKENDLATSDLPAYVNQAGQPKAISFDATKQQFGEFSNLRLVNRTAYSKVIWFKVDDLTRVNNLMSANLTTGHAFWGAGSNANCPAAGDNLSAGHAISTNWDRVSADRCITQSEWTLGVVTYDSTNGWALYQDGALVDTETVEKAMFADVDLITYLGRYGSGYNLDGEISKVYLYDRAISSQEVTSIFNASRSLFPAVLTIDPNGGSGLTTTQSIVKSVQISAPANSFTRTNFNFAGWNTKSDGTGDPYAAGDALTPTGNTTLFAQWTAASLGAPTLTFSYSDQIVPTLTSSASLNKGGSTGAATYSLLAYSAADAATGCAVNSSTGEVTATSAGKCRVQVSVAADGSYDAATAEAFATFLKSADKITWLSATVTVRSPAGVDRSVTMTTNPDYPANSNVQYTVEIKLGETIKLPFNSPNSERVGYTSYFRCPSVVGWDQSAMFPFDGSGNSFYYLNAKQIGNCSQTYNALTLPSNLYTSTLSPGILITVVKGDQQPISVVGSTTANFGEIVTLDATGGSGLGDRTYSVTGTGCSITTIPLSFGGRTYAALASAELTKSGAGACDVTVTKAGDTRYEPVTSSTHTVTFAKGSQELSFTSSVPSNPVAGTNYTPAATSSAGLQVSITASGTCSATAGVVTFNSTGTCTITASQGGNTDYLAATNVTQVIEVGTRNQTISFAAISDKEFGDPAFRITATSSESSLTVALTSADNTKCTVDGNGIVVLVAAGTCTIHADQAGTPGVVAAASRVTRSFEIFPAGSSAPFITSVSRGLGSLTATLIPPSYTGGATVTRYEVQAFDANGDLVATNNNCTVATAPAPQKCTVDGLVEGTNYTLRARAHHSGGVGSLSPASSAYSPIGNPDAVRELTALADNTSMTISWLAPLDLGGASFTRYDIFIKLASDNAFPGTASHTIGSVNAGSYTFTGLVNGESYEVKMVTITSVDTTEVTSNSALVSQVPFTTPNAVRDLTAIEVGENIFISWRYPDFDGGRPVLNYDVDVNSGALSCANVTSLYCTVAKGSETTFAMSTTADNLAGAGAPATFTLTLQAPLGGGSGGSGSSGGSGGGGFAPTPTPTPTLSSPKLDEQFPVIETGAPFVVELNGTNLNLITGVSVGTLTLRFEILSNEKIRVILPSRAAGNLKLILKYAAGQLEQDIVVRASSDKKVNAGSFNGVVALYAKGYIGQRLSAKVGEDWVIVNSLTDDYVRIVEPTRWVGHQIRVRIFIDRRLVNVIELTTE